MHLARKHTARRGASLVEGAIVLMVFLTLVLGTIDLGLGVLRYHLVSETARTLARQASVRGNTDPHRWPTWGPGSVEVYADNTASDISNFIRPYLATMDPSKVKINMDWPSGSNNVDDKVSVKITYYFPAFA